MLTKPSHVVLEEKDDIITLKTSKAKTAGSVVNIHIVYKITSKDITSTNVLRNSLFGATKASNTQKYNYSGFGIAFSSSTFKHPDSGKKAKNVLISDANLNASKYENNRKQSILVPGYG